MRYTFIVTYGRSGSTLLQGILNRIENWHIYGENLNFVYSCFLAIHQLEQAIEKSAGFGSDSPERPWFATDQLRLPLFQRRQLEAVRKTLERSLPPGIVCTGFKEVRYLDMLYTAEGQALFEPYLDFLRTGFPEARIIFNSRRHEDVLRSGWWASRSAEEVALGARKLREFEAKVQAYGAKYPAHCFQTSYEAMQNGRDGALEGLFEFLGSGLSAASLHAVLQTRHNP